MKKLGLFLLITISLFGCHKPDPAPNTPKGYAEIRSQYIYGIAAYIQDGRLVAYPNEYYWEFPTLLLDGDKISRVSTSDPEEREVIARIVGNTVVRTDFAGGRTIANIVGNRIIKGHTKYGNNIGITSDGTIPSGALGAVYLLLISDKQIPDRHLTYITVDNNPNATTSPQLTVQADRLSLDYFFKSSFTHIQDSCVVHDYNFRQRVVAQIGENKLIGLDGTTLSTIENDKVFKGETAAGTLLCSVDGDNPLAGYFGAAYYCGLLKPSTYDDEREDQGGGYITTYISKSPPYIMASVKNGQLYKGVNPHSPILLTLRGMSIYKGASTTGPVIATISWKALKDMNGKTIATRFENEIQINDRHYADVKGEESDAWALGAAYIVLIAGVENL